MDVSVNFPPDALQRAISAVPDRYGDHSYDRHVVNYLRHQFTDYDAHPIPERKREALDKIAEHFPQLADECERQACVRERLKADREANAARNREFLHEATSSPLLVRGARRVFNP